MQPRYVGLAGLGLLGSGIARCLVEHGFHVIALEKRDIAFESGLFTRADGAAGLARCELVIESITEDLEAKCALFEELEAQVSSRVPIVSNTSAIPISLLQAGRKHPQRFAGMHWAPPAYATRFLEIIRGSETDDPTIEYLVRMANDLDKEPAVVEKDVPGFVANRLAYAMYREALHMVEEGVADVAAIDLLCKNSLGLWTSLCGPFRWMDITGGPALYAKAMERVFPTLSNETGVSEVMRRERFYDYGADDAAQWQKKLHEHALKIWALGKP